MDCEFRLGDKYAGPEFFNQPIKRALHERKEKDALNRGRFIELEPSMLNLIQNS